MITIFHGDNFVLSRQALNQSLTSSPERFAAKGLTEETLTQALESNSMFTGDKIFVIENLLTLPRSRQKDQLIKIILNNRNRTVFLWEKKTVSPAVKKQFEKSTIKEFKLPQVIFQFLTSLSLKDFHQSLNTNPPELIFYLLHRRLSQLIQARDDPGSLKGAPWQLSQLKTQSRQFTLQKLIGLHQQLLDIDQQVKTGESDFNLTIHLDLLLADL